MFYNLIFYVNEGYLLGFPLGLAQGNPVDTYSVSLVRYNISIGSLKELKWEDDSLRGIYLEAKNKAYLEENDLFH